MKKDSLIEKPMVNCTSVSEKALIGHCPYCGHHININQGVHYGYCPLCDKALTRNEIERVPSAV